MRPFESIRVLDLTHVLAGPFSTYQLAALGAEVIKIEAPGNPDMTRREGVIPHLNDELRGIYFMAQNAGKKAITLNLKTEQGCEVLRQLVKTADVLVENYTSGSLAGLGLGFDDLAQINPSLIYCSITGFGQTGPKRTHPAYDVVIQAYSGLMNANGTPDTAPVRVGPPMVDYGTGAQAALAISAALFQRGQTGKGQHIDVSMLDCALMLMSAFTTDTLTTGHAPGPFGNAHPAYAGYSTYETADGLLMLGAWTNKQLANAMRALGLADRAREIETMPRSEVGQHRDADAAAIAKILKTCSADEWETVLNDAHVPAARVRTLQEALSSEQIASRKVIQNVPEPIGNGAPASLPVAGFSYAHGSPALSGPPPGLGQHNQELLGELGYGAGDLADMKQQGVI